MKAIRVGICALIAFAVLSFGGVEPWGAAILEIGASLLFVAWGILTVRRRQAEIRWNWLYLPLLGLGAFAFVQYGFGLSVYPYLTKLVLLRWGAYVLVFFLTVESFRTTEQVKRFVWFLVIFGFAVSLFGIIQHFTFNGKLYWSVPLTGGGSPFGPYVNRDDFAGFVELIAPLGLALLFFRAVRREHFPLVLLFTLVPIGAAILSASRGGITGLFFELILLAFLARARHVGKKQLAGIVALGLIAGTFIVWLGVSEAIHRFEQLPAELGPDSRISMYQDTWHIFLHHPWVGTGWGTLIAVFPRYSSFYIPHTIVDHAHNDYLELLADTGIMGGLCGLAFIVLLFWRGLKNVQAAERRLPRAIFSGSLVACAGMLLHSLVDFNLHIPANALIFLLLGALATSQMAEGARGRFSEPLNRNS
jgi:O-antigen ligase